MGMKPPGGQCIQHALPFIAIAEAHLPSLDRTLRLVGPYAATTPAISSEPTLNR
jgi:hypothetical protein